MPGFFFVGCATHVAWADRKWRRFSALENETPHQAQSCRGRGAVRPGYKCASPGTFSLARCPPSSADLVLMETRHGNSIACRPSLMDVALVVVVIGSANGHRGIISPQIFVRMSCRQRDALRRPIVSGPSAANGTYSKVHADFRQS